VITTPIFARPASLRSNARALCPWWRRGFQPPGLRGTSFTHRELSNIVIQQKGLFHAAMRFCSFDILPDFQLRPGPVLIVEAS